MLTMHAEYGGWELDRLRLYPDGTRRVVLRRENDFVTGMPSDAASRYGFDLDWNPEGLTLRSGPTARSRH